MDRNETIEKFYRKNYKQLVSMTRNRVPNKSHHLAEEVVQEAFCNALKYWYAFDAERGNIVTWFNRILQNCVNKCLREEQGTSTLDDDEVDLTPFLILEDRQIPKRIALKIMVAIEAEKSPKREILNMFFVLGMRPIDIAAVLNIDQAAIRMMIMRWRGNWEDENIFS